MSTLSIGSLNQLADSLEKAGFTPKDVTKLKQFGLTEVLNVLDGLAEIKPKEYCVNVRYDRRIEASVWGGHYDRSNGSIGITIENFPAPKSEKEKVTIELPRFHYKVSMDGALAELDKMGFRPANVYELLAFADTYPDVQRQFCIIALGSILQCDGLRPNICYIHGDSSEREVGLALSISTWKVGCCFAAVRK